MRRAAAKKTRRGVGSDPTLGEIASIDEQRRAFVRFSGAVTPVLARSVLEPAQGNDSLDSLVGARVLLHFENGDPSLPIIVGVVRDELRLDARMPQFQLDLGKERDVLIDGRRLVLEAGLEIQIRCGKSLVALQRDGRILIRGAHLVSRASGPNKIKGGSISLN